MRLSIVIPAYQEAPLIADAVRCARDVADEVIVADAHSPDGTGEIAAREGVPVVQAEKGRGPQLLAGAAAATGDVLLFLHADARLAARARDAVLGAMADPEVVGGAFFIRFLPQSWFTRALEPGNDARRRITRRYYGDTAIFARADVYRRLGGHRAWKVMHDYEFSGRLEGAGRTVYIEDPPVWASARRFEGREIRTLLTWMSVQSLYRLGLPPRLLSPLYPDVRGGNPERFIATARERTGRPPPDRATGDRR